MSSGPVSSQTPTFRVGASIASLAAEAERRQRYVRVARATFLLVVILVSGTYGYWWLTDGAYDLVHCLFMTVITVSTVGFEEAIPLADDGSKAFTMGLILFGGASLLYFFTAVASSVIEGDLIYGFFRRRQEALLRRLSDHVIVVGLGRTGTHAADELWYSRPTLLVIDQDAQRVEALLARYRVVTDQLHFLVADAFHEDTLRAARVERARGLVAALTDDRDNLLLCLTAKELNPRLAVVAKVADAANAGLFEELGVSALVDPATMGGARLANELVRPRLVAFTDAMLAAEAHRKQLAELPIHPAARVVDRTLESADLAAATGCIIMGLRYSASGPYRYDPAPDSPLVAGGGVLALGDRPQLRALRRLLGRPRRVALREAVTGRRR